MPRRPRIHAANAFYHVTLRGNHQQPIFFDRGDRRLLNGIVSDVAAKFGARIHAYCWMTNHIHLLAQIADAPLSSVIHGVAGQYARRVQARLETTGHLFERRYHAVLVDADSYFLELVRYIHLNPVRAGLCRTAREHPWSSHAAYLGHRSDAWVTTDFGLAMLHPQRRQACRAYASFIADGESSAASLEIPAPNEREPRILGNDDFAARATPTPWRPRTALTLEQLIEQTCRAMTVDARQLTSPSRERRLAHVRAIIARRAVDERVATLAAVARAFGRDESSLREGVARLTRVRRE